MRRFLPWPVLSSAGTFCKTTQWTSGAARLSSFAGASSLEIENENYAQWQTEPELREKITCLAV
jgi:hypothetical protein